MKFLTLLFIPLLLIGCKTNLSLNVQEPPAVFLPKSYVSAGVINRTLTSGTQRILDKIESGLTLEGPELDYVGSTDAVQSCFDELTRNPRFQKVLLLDEMQLQTPGMDVFPAHLDWSEVEQICIDNDVQVLFVLEMFDTDTKVTYSQQTRQVNNPLGGTVPVIEHTATSRTNLKTGWRIYDPGTKTILDQFYVSDFITNTGTGINPMKAASTLINRKEAVKQVSKNVGRMYANRVEYVVFRVRRDFYNKGSRNLKIGRRKALIGDWDGAAEYWEKDLTHRKRKVAGRATYNMAVYAEINGDVEKAYELANKAYTEFGITYARNYAAILNQRLQRIARNKMFEEQDNNGEEIEDTNSNPNTGN